jgi:hypothetical protein
MRFSELVSYTREYGAAGHGLLVAIPAFRDYDGLVRHLAYLSKQSFQDFDVLLVLGVPFDDKRMQAHVERSKFKFGVIIAKENERRGCSGGFFACQKYALEKGYKYEILADDDCMPIDPGLIEALYASREKRYVSCTMEFVVDKNYRKTMVGTGPSQYTLFDTGLFRKYGIYYLPLFHGADDGEYMERLSGVPKFVLPNKVEHPYSLGGKFVLSNLDRAMVFFNASLIIMRSLRSTLYNLALFCIYLPTYFLFFPEYGKRLFSTMLRLLLTYTYGKAALDAMKSGFEKSIFTAKEAGIQLFDELDDTKPEYVSGSSGKKLLSLVSNAISWLRKDVVVINTFSYLKVALMAITARKLYAKIGEDRYLLVADNRNPVLHAARLFAFAFFVPLFALFVFPAFFLVKALKQPNTMGYGLD